VGAQGAKTRGDWLCLASIARFKGPKDYVFVDGLPKNNYGKILKTGLRAQDAKRSLRPPSC
jgi:long-chain acyl-CoA synthetase